MVGRIQRITIRTRGRKAVDLVHRARDAQSPYFILFDDIPALVRAIAGRRLTGTVAKELMAVGLLQNRK